MHSHVKQAVNREVQSICSTDHLPIVYESEVRASHCVVMGIVLVGHLDQFTVPLVISKIFLHILFSVRAFVCADNSHEVSFEGQGLG